MHRIDTMARTILVVVIALTGCFGSTKNPEACQDGVCIDPERNYCDSDGSVAGQADTCIAFSCQPGEFVACSKSGGALACTSSGDDTTEMACAVGCDTASAGCIPEVCVGDKLVRQLPDNTVTMETCAAGCTSSPSPHCTHIVPRYLPDVCEVSAAMPELVVGVSGTFDTDLDSNCNGGVVAQTSAPAICVARFGRIEVAPGASLRVTGERALAMVADTELRIAGELDVSANGSTSGPGGGSTSSGGSGPFLNGAGGAGSHTVGGSGGSTTVDGGANNRGVASDPTILVPLLGGASGGASCRSSQRPAA
jgi:hypothetical protein